MSYKQIDLKALKELCMLIGPSGHEKSIIEYIKGQLPNQQIKTDTLGNLIIHKPGSGKKLMLCAHMDEKGVMTTYSDQMNYRPMVQNDCRRDEHAGMSAPMRSSYVRFASIGKFDPHAGDCVTFLDETQGIISKEQKEDNYFIDCCGVTSIKPGQAAAYSPSFHLQEDYIISKALDSRIGLGILIDLLQGDNLASYDLYVAFTVMDKLNHRGIYSVVKSVMPQMCLVLSGVNAVDIPGCKSPQISLGKGPAIKIMDSGGVAHSVMVNMLKKAANEPEIPNQDPNQIPYQLEISDKKSQETPSAMGVVMTIGGGIIAGGISIPIRYMGSCREMVSIRDIEQLNALLLRL